jgi:hypothetical protein
MGLRVIGAYVLWYRATFDVRVYEMSAEKINAAAEGYLYALLISAYFPCG